MIRFKLILCFVSSILFLHGCSQILEPVSLFATNQDVSLNGEQEEFDINIKSLTFKTAAKANNSPYSRQLIRTGSGSRANVLDEADFLKPNFPSSPSNKDYFLGVGDELSFFQQMEFATKNAQWPNISDKTEYLLGPGDELTFTQSSGSNQDISVSINDMGNIVPQKEKKILISTKGVIGSNGNMLLFGLGNIQAANRTLDNLRNEIRNIIIRKGQAPNFQLEISNFQSQKAFLTNDSHTSKIIYLNNIPVSLKQIALAANISKSHKNLTLIKLTRDAKEFRLTAEQLFNLEAPEIIKKANDQIELSTLLNLTSSNTKSVVGYKGYIILPIVGRISVINRTLDDVSEEITSILISKGFVPNFQLEISEFASKKAYLIQKNAISKTISLNNTNLTLRQILVDSNISSLESDIESLTVITLKRNGKVFRMTGEQVLDPNTPTIWIVDEDHIEVENFAYKPGTVFTLSGAGKAKIVEIYPSRRENLANILFESGGPFSNLLAKRSEVYLLRGQNPSIAYHLDTQNVSRIMVAANTELRPNDIVYVADRPIISFSRTLSEILPLRGLLRDIRNNDIP